MQSPRPSLVPFVLAFGLLVGATASARPVSFVGSKMPMLQAQPMMVTASLDVTPLRPVSFGASYQWMQRTPAEQAEFAGIDANLLLFRHNAADWQANAFLLTVVGAVRDSTGSLSPAASAAIEIDAETRHLYGLVQGRYLRSLDGFEDPQLLARVGVAPFVAEYDEINPFVILQYQYMPRFAQPHVVTPMLRLLYRSVLVEVGASLRGEWLLNFTAEI